MEAFLPSLVEIFADGVVVVTEDGTVRYTNKAAKALFGRDLVGELFVHPVRDCAIAIAGNSAPKLAEMRVAECEWDGAPARVAVIRDVTEQDHRLALDHQLAVSDKRAAIRQLASSVAHEINNPAAFMLANLAVMRDIVAEFETVFAQARISRSLRDKFQIPQSLADMREMIADNEHGLDRIRSFLREFKAITRDASDTVESVDLATAASLACDLRAEGLPRGVTLVRTLDPVPNVTGDRLKMIQLIGYLIDNAVRAAEKSEQKSGVVEVGTSRSGQWSVVSVRDNGCGIAESDFDKIFDPLFAGSAVERRIGLGLPIAADIASDFGGRVELIRSEVGKGSEFRLFFPREGKRSRTGLKQKVAPGHVRARVLFIGDDSAMSRKIRDMLQASHDVIDAGGSSAALSHLARDRDYDVVLCDVAEDTARSLHQVLSDKVPRLAARMIFLVDRAQSAPGKPFLGGIRPMVLDKPISRDLLREMIERVGG